MSLIIKKYTHAPTHWFIDDFYYFFTGAVYQKKRLLATVATKDLFIKYLFQFIEKFQWELLEWVLLENHYHFLYNPVKHHYVKNLDDYRFSSFHIRKAQEEHDLRKKFLLYKPQTITYYNDIDDF